jgi:hypothetical protein
MGTARPHQLTRHVHPAVKPDDTAPIEATGIDYLRLLEDAHQREVGQAINYLALTDNTDPTPDPDEEHDDEQDDEKDDEQDDEQDDEEQDGAENA